MKKITYLDRPDIDKPPGAMQYLPAGAANQVFDMMCRIVDRPYTLSRQWLIENRFVAVPLPENMNDQERESLAATLREKELLPLFGVVTELVEEAYYKRCVVELLSIDAEVLWAYESAFTMCDFLLFSESGRLVMLQAEIGWHVFAGTRELVESAMGQSLESAREEFDEHVAYYLDNYSDGYFAFLGQKLAEARDYYRGINDSILNSPDES